MDEDLDLRAHELARQRHQQIYLSKVGWAQEPGPQWEDLPEQQQARKAAEADRWISAARAVSLLDEYRPRPTEEQLSALAEFLTARRIELEDQGARVDPIVRQAVHGVWGRIIEGLAYLKTTLDNAPEPWWHPRAAAIWAELTTYARFFDHHPGYRPETWTP